MKFMGDHVPSTNVTQVTDRQDIMKSTVPLTEEVSNYRCGYGVLYRVPAAHSLLAKPKASHLLVLNYTDMVVSLKVQTLHKQHMNTADRTKSNNQLIKCLT